MTDTTFVKIPAESYDDMVAIYWKAQNIIMELRLEIYELETELACTRHKLEQLN